MTENQNTDKMTRKNTDIDTITEVILLLIIIGMVIATIRIVIAH